MKIVYVTPGFGGSYYCQNCLRDTTLVAALRSRGADVSAARLYLPVSAEGSAAINEGPIFFGAINTYLQEKAAVFRRTPRWVDRVFDWPRLLGLLGKMADSAKPRGHEEMTLSMLRGEDGNQAKELERFIEWLRLEGAPDVVHLSNALLLGMAGRIKRDVGAAVVCSLLNEHDWVDAMEERFRAKVWGLMRKKAADVDAFAAASDYYGGVMRELMDIPAERLHTVYAGIDLGGYGEGGPSFSPPTIGYISRLSGSFGLGILVTAFMDLKAREEFRDLRLMMTGGQAGEDGRFVAGIKRRLEAGGMAGDVEFVEDFSGGSRARFLRELSVLSVPVVKREAFGMYALEAMASGVPVVEPRLGAFGEIVEATGGGILYEPNDAGALAEALGAVLVDPEGARRLGAAGRKAVFERFGGDNMAREMVSLYERVLTAVRNG